jgi:hypothetical protein
VVSGPLGFRDIIFVFLLYARNKENISSIFNILQTLFIWINGSTDILDLKLRTGIRTSCIAVTY